MFLVPNSKECASLYVEGPDANLGKCESCQYFYWDENKRCCKQEPLALVDGEIVKTRFIENDVVSCGAFSSVVVIDPKMEYTSFEKSYISWK